MKKLSNEALERIAQAYGKDVPGLTQELQTKLKEVVVLDDQEVPASVTESAVAAMVAATELPEVDLGDDGDVANERIVAVSAGARPVARIRNNQVTTEFLGPDNESWAAAITGARDAINRVIPSVGRIELNNSDFPWAGTGWMIADGILVTNRHVAEVFARIDRQTSSFVFKPGLVSGSVSSDVDFLEEENRLDAAEHPVTSILWIAPADEADVAFLRITRAAGGPALPAPIELSDEVVAGTTIGAIGYPARDPSIRDQQLVVQIFGDDVYEKKRFAPGRVMSVDGNRIKHDCSTLGGNSGSLLVDFATGKGVGLHHGGLVNDSANLAVTAAHVRALLANALRRETPARNRPPAPAPQDARPVADAVTPGTYRMKLHVPIEIIINVGAPVQIAGPATLDAAAPPAAASFDAALQMARERFGPSDGVLRVRPGYRFKNGWITDERVIVLEVSEKLAFGNLQPAGRAPLPREISGVGIDVRVAPLVEQLDALGIDIAAERPGRPAGYVEPRGFDRPDSPMFLGRVKERMSAIFHVSPDAGFTNLRGFLKRTKRSLTATMFEWDANHISDTIEEVMTPSGRSLRMVTQKKGVGGRDATQSAVEDMQSRIGRKFKHVFASVRGPNRLIPDSYHIKVASRDGEEVWLSSGNWKESNQPKTAASAGVLRTRNREWHAIIANERLATLFQRYIEFDFREAERSPLEDGEAAAFPDLDVFVPEEAVAVSPEAVPGVTYKDTLQIDDEELDIQPLLTPDRDANGKRLFMRVATEMVSRAKERIYVQNQSFNLTDENNQEFDHFFDVLKRKQEEIADVRIIFRDAVDFGRPADLEKQQELIERLKDFGLDTSPDAMRLQSKCHTKGIIVDSKEVLLGSQNLTNGGSLFNRDASLLVRSPKVAKFFENIFLFDWEHLTHNDAEERVNGIRRAAPGEPTPPGFRRVKLSELLGDD